MKVYEGRGNTPERFVGVCKMDPPRVPHLIVQVGEDLVAIYRLARIKGKLGLPEVIVVLEPGQSPEHLPGFMSTADCARAMSQAA